MLVDIDESLGVLALRAIGEIVPGAFNDEIAEASIRRIKTGSNLVAMTTALHIEILAAVSGELARSMREDLRIVNSQEIAVECCLCEDATAKQILTQGYVMAFVKALGAGKDEIVDIAAFRYMDTTLGELAEQYLLIRLGRVGENLAQELFGGAMKK